MEKLRWSAIITTARLVKKAVFPLDKRLGLNQTANIPLDQNGLPSGTASINDIASTQNNIALLTDSLDINFIGHTLMPYLNVLNDIQATILDINQQDPTPITLSSLHAMSKPNTIELQLYIYPQLLFFLRDHVQKWVNKGEQEKDDTFLVAVYRRSAKDMLAQLTPTTTANDLYTTYVERLQTDLQKLFGFDIKIVTMLES